ncbi:hypothetical protein [Salinispora arenicola]|uniref:hypothetical protein n=1 Tax=Salinispora arenicola TaxID=168697 RepID=UPI0012BB5BF0|nr:hypothetical protein [Salinispora arenicola]
MTELIGSPDLPQQTTLVGVVKKTHHLPWQVSARTEPEARCTEPDPRTAVSADKPRAKTTNQPDPEHTSLGSSLRAVHGLDGKQESAF